MSGCSSNKRNSISVHASWRRPDAVAVVRSLHLPRSSFNAAAVKRL